MTKFSIVVPVRDTPQEREFASKSLPVLAALDPAELLVGVDAPTAPDFLAFLLDIGGMDGQLRVVEVPHDPAWKFHLAHVTWRLYEECRYDIVLTSTVDYILPAAIKHGVELIGAGHDAATCMIQLYVDGLGDLIRRKTNKRICKRLLANQGFVRSGVYWMDRRTLGNIRPRLQAIHNGIDTVILDQLEMDGRSITTIPNAVAESLSPGNADQPWRQFGGGIWHYANSVGGLKAVSVTILYWWPWFLRGYLWAARHPTHTAVKAARGVTRTDWTGIESQHVRGLKDWDRYGRTGTGFGS